MNIEFIAVLSDSDELSAGMRGSEAKADGSEGAVFETGTKDDTAEAGVPDG